MSSAFTRSCLTALVLFAVALPASAGELVMVAGIPLDFILFA